MKTEEKSIDMATGGRGGGYRPGTDAEASGRIVFLDYLRVIACMMVMVVHACECFYFGADGGLHYDSAGDAFWATWIDSAVRACVPLFVIASSYLLFPVTRPTGEFFRRRLVRVVVPFVIWCGLYLWRFDGNAVDCLFNFPMATGGHLWFVPMLSGLYLLMPLLTPWAERANEKEVRGWLILWLFTTTFPFLRKLCGLWCGAPSYGVTPYLYGECPWNEFGAFQFVSGFFGYLLLGLYCRRFVPTLSWLRTLAFAVPSGLCGYAIVGAFFYWRIPGGGAFPVSAPYAAVVDLEMSWTFCSTGVALMTVAYFLVIRKFTADGWFYRKVIVPLSSASYGAYLMHIMVLVVLSERLKGAVPTPVAIVGIAAGSFAVSSGLSMLVRRIPYVGRLVCG